MSAANNAMQLTVKSVVFMRETPAIRRYVRGGLIPEAKHHPVSASTFRHIYLLAGYIDLPSVVDDHGRRIPPQIS